MQETNKSIGKLIIILALLIHIPFIAEITFKKKGGSNAAVKPNVKSPCKSRFDIRRKTQ